MVTPCARLIPPYLMNRRELLFSALGTSALAAGCSRKLAPRYFGWLLVASATEKGIAVADLSEFRHITTLGLNETPGQILRVGSKVFATCPEARQLVEIDTSRFSAGIRVQMPGRIVAAAAAPDAGLLVLATAQPATLVIVEAKSARILHRIPLSSDPSGLDVSGAVAAVAGRTTDNITRFSLKDGRLLGATKLGEVCASMRFRNDGRAILAGLPNSRQIVTLNVETGALLARLPLRFAPGRFCFNADGGQMFVTAVGEDAVAIVSPYQSQVDQTIVAGRTPWGMAVSATRNLLLISNPASGDLTILDIETRRLSASVHIGGEPGQVLLTPDEEYALVISRDAGDVAVVRMRTVLDRSVKTKPLLTMFPMGGLPQSTLIIPKEA